jgi:hypothetical protein
LKLKAKLEAIRHILASSAETKRSQPKVNLGPLALSYHEQLRRYRAAQDKRGHPRDQHVAAQIKLESKM